MRVATLHTDMTHTKAKSFGYIFKDIGWIFFLSLVLRHAGCCLRLCVLGVPDGDTSIHSQLLVEVNYILLQ